MLVSFVWYLSCGDTHLTPIGDSISPLNLCCSLRVFTYPNRPSFLPLHFFGSQCSKSHMPNGHGKFSGAYDGDSSSLSEISCKYHCGINYFKLVIINCMINICNNKALTNLAKISCMRLKIGLQYPKLLGNQFNTNHRLIVKLGNQNFALYTHLCGYTMLRVFSAAVYFLRYFVGVKKVRKN